MKPFAKNHLFTARKSLLAKSALLIGALMATGCGPGFKTSALNANLASTGATGTTEQGTLRTVTAPTSLKAGWVSEDGFIGTNAAAKLYYETTIKIPYGWAYTAASLATRFASPLACSFRDVEKQKNPYRDYAHGEIPCGVMVDGGYKRVTTIDIEPYVDTKDGYKVAVAGASVPVYISRTQYTGTYKESRLDGRKVESVRSSQYFGDDISIRYEPKADGTSMRLYLCAALPGIEVTAPTQSIYAKASKNVGFIKLAYDTRFTVNVGKAKFDYVRGCFATDVKFTGDKFVPAFDFKVIEKPKVVDVQHTGIYLRIEDFWLRLLDRVLSVFKTGIKKQIVKVANREVQEIADSKLETGEWFSMVHGEAALQNLTETVNRSTMRALRQTGLPLSGSEMRAQLKRQCSLLPLFKQVDVNFKEACTRAIDAVKIAVLPFYRDPQMAAEGCYSHYANIHETRGNDGKFKWWASKCGFAMQLQLRVVVDIDAEAKKALTNVLASMGELDRWVDLARQKLGWKEEDETLLLFAAEEAIKRGDKLGSLEDLLSVANRYRPTVEDRLRNFAATAL